jgi:hypothetical protein
MLHEVYHLNDSGKPAADLQFFLSVVPKHTQDAVAAALIIAIGYLLGSAVCRVSRNFFDDEFLWLHLPTENQIRGSVYRNAYCTEKLLKNLNLPVKELNLQVLGQLQGGDRSLLCSEAKKGMEKSFNEDVQKMFRLQEGVLLLYGQDKVDRLKQYYDQITVLRGAALKKAHTALKANCSLAILAAAPG